MATDTIPSPRLFIAGMHDELRTLEMLREVAREQRAASEPDSGLDLAALVHRRQDIEDELHRLEQTVRPLRVALAAPGVALDADERAACEAVQDKARQTVADILAIDRDTLAALMAARETRQARLHHLDTGEATLAAYRRTVRPTTAPKELINQVG